MRLNVYEWGEPGATPVVCLHGVTSYGGRFDWLAERSGRHVLSLDLLGHGHSTWEPPWDVDAHLAAILETVPDGPAVWVGHSFGGRLVGRARGPRPRAGRAARAASTPPSRCSARRLRPGRDGAADVSYARSKTPCRRATTPAACCSRRATASIESDAATSSPAPTAASATATARAR